MLTRRRFLRATGATLLCACVGSARCRSEPTSDTPPAPEGSCRIEGESAVLNLSAATTLQGVGGAVRFSV